MTYFHNMKVPVAGAVISEDDLSLALAALKAGDICHGKYNTLFERAFADRLSRTYAVSCNSGSSANLLAVSALGLQPGDEVITTALNFATTVNPIVQCGATPVFIDCGLDGNAKWENVNAAITPKTKAVILAHSLGRSFDGLIIYALRQMGIPIIEDCCDALGSEYGAYDYLKPVGARADMATFSFYPAHQITTGEGGMVVTNDAVYAKTMRSFRDWGRDCYCDPGHDDTCGHRFAGGMDHKYTYSHIGYNLKMTNIQAAIGLKQLTHLGEFVDARERNYKYLDNYFHAWHTEDPNGYPFLNLKVRRERTSYFGYPLIILNGMNRRLLLEYLENKGVGVRTWFSGNITKQPAYKDVSYRIHGELRMTNRLAKDAFWIGCHPGLTLDHLDYAGDRMREYVISR
jgi:CDP-4-dehydro-6-deoxyglucose reductase, E1